MPKIARIQKMKMTEARKVLTKLDRLLAPNEIVCIERKTCKVLGSSPENDYYVPVYAVVPWDMFEQMYEIMSTVEDKLQMLEFTKFMKDRTKTHVFTDIFRKFYTQQGYYEPDEEERK